MAGNPHRGARVADAGRVEDARLVRAPLPAGAGGIAGPAGGRRDLGARAGRASRGPPRGAGPPGAVNAEGNRALRLASWAAEVHNSYTLGLSSFAPVDVEPSL